MSTWPTAITLQPRRSERAVSWFPDTSRTVPSAFAKLRRRGSGRAARSTKTLHQERATAACRWAKRWPGSENTGVEGGPQSAQAPADHRPSPLRIGEPGWREVA